MTHLDAGIACHDFTDTLQRVSLGKERIVLQSQGHDVAVLVPIEDLPLIERMEDLADIRAAEAAEAEAATNGEKPIPWKKARQADALAWLEEVDRLREKVAARCGILPDSTLDIAADRSR
jgi:hypothetical protein